MSDNLQQSVSSSISFNPTAGYIIANEPPLSEASNTILYYGFVSHDGGWYIHRRDVTSGENKFAKGYCNYSTNWGTRVSQTYEYFHITFRSSTS